MRTETVTKTISYEVTIIEVRCICGSIMEMRCTHASDLCGCLICNLPKEGYYVRPFCHACKEDYVESFFFSR